MADREDTAEPDPRMLAELSALADGRLEGGRAAALRRQIDESPELSQRYQRELRAISALDEVRADRAPARLRTAVASQRQAVPGPKRRLVYGGALTAAVAGAVAALILLLPGGAPGAPSVSQAAALALRGPAMAAPATHPGAKLNQDVQEIYFPDWSGLGWRAVGQRIDHLGSRLAVTVYYGWRGRQIAYTILSAPALRWPGAQTRWMHGVELQSLVSGRRVIVTWRRAGHTCVLSGSGVSASQLVGLAVREA